ncbi:TPA: hypothetical protein N0F65_008961, partial [Lagenidium giganteum]
VQANQAAKKAQRTSASLSQRLTQWIIPINVLYVLFRLGWHYATVTRWTLFGYAFLVSTTYMSFAWVVGAAEEGGKSEYAMDVLIITLFVQAGLLVSDYFWLVFLLIPGYLLYHGGRMLLNYVFTPDPTEEEPDAAAIKRKEKAERRAQRVRYR